MNDRLRMLQRQPKRITITLSYHVHEALLSRSEEEGRSVSNLCAYLLEDSLRNSTRLPVAAEAMHPELLRSMAVPQPMAKQSSGVGHFKGG